MIAIESFRSILILLSIHEDKVLIYRFSGRIRTFNTVALLSYNLFSLQLRELFFQVSNILVLRGAYCFFNHFDEFVRVVPQQQFGCLKFLNH
jgi:hypothetical protein